MRRGRGRLTNLRSLCCLLFILLRARRGRSMAVAVLIERRVNLAPRLGAPPALSDKHQ